MYSAQSPVLPRSLGAECHVNYLSEICQRPACQHLGLIRKERHVLFCLAFEVFEKIGVSWHFAAGVGWWDGSDLGIRLLNFVLPPGSVTSRAVQSNRMFSSDRSAPHLLCASWEPLATCGC